MFSFIKTIQELMRKLKKKKGLLFMLLTAISVSGIILFMYLIMTLTSNVKIDVYKNISKSNDKSIESVLQNRQILYKNITQAMILNDKIVEDIRLNNMDNLNAIAKSYNTLIKKDDKYPPIIQFYPIINAQAITRDTIRNVLKSKSVLFGIETQSDGVYITYLKPVFKDGNFLGLIELRQSIHSLQFDYLKQDSHFMFVLDKKMLVKLSIKAKSDNYKQLNGNYLVKTGVYKSTFYSKVIDIEPNKFALALKKSYDSDDKFFRSYKKVTDINGVEIGLYVFGENVKSNNGFVKLVDKMIKSTTYISLGLVISILLFMF